MKILVTGAAGFIGYHTSLKLHNAGHEVVLVDNMSRGVYDASFQELVQSNSLKYYNIDMSDKDSWNSMDGEYDMVFNFAAINGTRYFYEKPYEVLRVNISTMLHLLEWCELGRRCKRIIWTSSSEVYAGVKNITIPTSEDTAVGVDNIFNPRYSYGISKIAGEALMINYCRANNLAYTVVRPHNIYGPRMGYEHVIPEFIMRIREGGEYFKIFGGDQTRAFCYIDDFVKALLLIADHEDSSNGEIFHIGNDKEEVMIQDLARMLFGIAGCHPKIELFQPLEGSVSRRKPTLKKAKELINYEPSIDLYDGLIRTYEWYLKEGGKV